MRAPFCLLAAAGIVAAAGCARTACQRSTVAVVSCEPAYQRVVLADFECRPIAEYIAEGPITETCERVCFRAVQRRIFHPCTLTFRYPLGRPVKVQGSNIVITPTPAPAWMR